MRRFVLMATVATLISFIFLVSMRAQQSVRRKNIEDDGMSPMGHLAFVKAQARAFLRDRGLSTGRRTNGEEGLECDDNGCDPGGEDIGPASTQSEVAIAIDPTGTHVVVGFNDFRGFNLNPLSVSGVAYS